jgi:hypothetical protein
MRDTIIIEDLMVWPRDLGEMTWNEATIKVKELGEGWRLPTIEEFKNILYPNKSKIPNLQDLYYWSRTEKGLSFAWYYRFYHGGSGNHMKSRLGCVRAVKTFNGEAALELLLKDF